MCQTGLDQSETKNDSTLSNEGRLDKLEMKNESTLSSEVAPTNIPQESEKSENTKAKEDIDSIIKQADEEYERAHSSPSTTCSAIIQPNAASTSNTEKSTSSVSESLKLYRKPLAPQEKDKTIKIENSVIKVKEIETFDCLKEVKNPVSALQGTHRAICGKGYESAFLSFLKNNTFSVPENEKKKPPKQESVKVEPSFNLEKEKLNTEPAQTASIQNQTVSITQKLKVKNHSVSLSPIKTELSQIPQSVGNEVGNVFLKAQKLIPNLVKTENISCPNDVSSIKVAFSQNRQFFQNDSGSSNAADLDLFDQLQGNSRSSSNSNDQNAGFRYKIQPTLQSVQPQNVSYSSLTTYKNPSNDKTVFQNQANENTITLYSAPIGNTAGIPQLATTCTVARQASQVTQISLQPHNLSQPENLLPISTVASNQIIVSSTPQIPRNAQNLVIVNQNSSDLISTKGGLNVYCLNPVSQVPVLPKIVLPPGVTLNPTPPARKPNTIWNNQNWYSINACPNTIYLNKERFFPMSDQPIQLGDDNGKDPAIERLLQDLGEENSENGLEFGVVLDEEDATGSNQVLIEGTTDVPLYSNIIDNSESEFLSTDINLIEETVEEESFNGLLDVVQDAAIGMPSEDENVQDEAESFQEHQQKENDVFRYISSDVTCYENDNNLLLESQQIMKNEPSNPNKKVVVESMNNDIYNGLIALNHIDNPITVGNIIEVNSNEMYSSPSSKSEGGNDNSCNNVSCYSESSDGTRIGAKCTSSTSMEDPHHHTNKHKKISSIKKNVNTQRTNITQKTRIHKKIDSQGKMMKIFGKKKQKLKGKKVEKGVVLARDFHKFQRAKMEELVNLDGKTCSSTSLCSSKKPTKQSNLKNKMLQLFMKSKQNKGKINISEIMGVKKKGKQSNVEKKKNIEILRDLLKFCQTHVTNSKNRVPPVPSTVLDQNVVPKQTLEQQKAALTPLEASVVVEDVLTHFSLNMQERLKEGLTLCNVSSLPMVQSTRKAIVPKRSGRPPKQKSKRDKVSARFYVGLV